MTEAKSNAVTVGESFVKEAELWMDAQGDVLAGMETMITGWMQRQLQAYEASARSMQRICQARNMLDLVQAQHEWLSDCLNWTASQIRAAGDEIPAITRMAVERFGEGGNGRQRSSPPAQHASDMAMQRAAE